MSSSTYRIANTTDGPLIIDDEGHVLASREATRVKSIDDEPIAGHLEAGRLIDTTDAKADAAEAEEAAELARLEAEEEAARLAEADEAAKTKAAKAATTTARS
jgi:hypothetical protein